MFDFKLRIPRVPLFRLSLAVLTGVSMLCGCATRRSEDISDLLRELEAIEALNDGAETPAASASDTIEPVYETSVADARVEPVSESRSASRQMADPSGPAGGSAGPEEARAVRPERGAVPSEPRELDAPDAQDPGLAEPQNSAPPAGMTSRPDRESDGGVSTNPLPVGVLTIQPDCLVQVGVEEDPSLDGNYPVNKIGAIELGYVGPVILYNKTEDQAAAKIAEVLRSRHFRKATVDVKILRASYDRVQVVGAVNRPDLIKIGAGDTISLNDLLLRAGGVKPGTESPFARVVRGGLTSAMAAALPGEEYALLSEEGLPSIPDVELRNNDLVQVYSQPVGGPVGRFAASVGGARQVLVLGEVKRPGIYQFSPQEPCSILYLVFKMGGLPPYANTKKIRVMRMNDQGEEVEYTVDARDVLREGDPEDDFELLDGDRIVVPARRISLF